MEPMTSEIEESDMVPLSRCFLASVLSAMSVMVSYARCIVEDSCRSLSILWMASISTSLGGGKRSIFRRVRGDSCDKVGSWMGLFWFILSYSRLNCSRCRGRDLLYLASFGLTVFWRICWISDTAATSFASL